MCSSVHTITFGDFLFIFLLLLLLLFNTPMKLSGAVVNYERQLLLNASV